MSKVVDPVGWNTCLKKTGKKKEEKEQRKRVFDYNGECNKSVISSEGAKETDATFMKQFFCVYLNWTM